MNFLSDSVNGELNGNKTNNGKKQHETEDKICLLYLPTQISFPTCGGKLFVSEKLTDFPKRQHLELSNVIKPSTFKPQ